jgi:hypothetical protein
VYRVWSDTTVCHRDPSLVVEQRTALIDQALAGLRRSGQLRRQHMRQAAQACFEMARRLADIDLDRATRYYRARRQKNLILLRGNAAPWTYRLAHFFGGFRRAELLAARRRGIARADELAPFNAS